MIKYVPDQHNTHIYIYIYICLNIVYFFGMVLFALLAYFCSTNRVLILVGFSILTHHELLGEFKS